MAIPETPLFVKTQDFIVWLIRHSQRFPKNLRQSYTSRLEAALFDFQESILMANSVRGAKRADWLDHADGKLLVFRGLLRLAGELELLGSRQLKCAAQCVDELGRFASREISCSNSPGMNVQS